MLMRFNLKIDQTDSVARPLGSSSHELEADLLQPKIDFCIQEWARMNEKHLHEWPPCMGNMRGRVPSSDPIQRPLLLSITRIKGREFRDPSDYSRIDRAPWG